MTTLVRGQRLRVSNDLDSVDGELMDGIVAARDSEAMAAVVVSRNACDVRIACECILLGNPGRAARIFDVVKQRPDLRRKLLQKVVSLDQRLPADIVTRARAILKSDEGTAKAAAGKNSKGK